MPLSRGATDAVVAATVLTVNVDVPEPPATEVGSDAQVAGRVATGVTVQVKATALLKPFTGADPYCGCRRRSCLDGGWCERRRREGEVGIGAAVTVKVAVAVWLSKPLVPAMVTV